MTARAVTARSVLAASSLVLALVGLLWCAAGAGGAALSRTWWSNGLEVVVLALLALLHLEDVHCAAALALVGAAYARLPVREAWGIELWPLEAAVALPLWAELWSHGKAPRAERAVAASGLGAAAIAAAAAPALPLHAHWIATAPLALLALAWLGYRHRLGLIAVCVATLLLPALHVTVEVLVPAYPATVLAPFLNVLMFAAAAAALTQLSLRRVTP